MSDPTTGHLDVDGLADLLSGELPPAEHAAATAHLADCDRCSEALADLDAALVPVSAELAALAASPLPPVPADLEQVLLARLAAEPVPEPVPGPVPSVPAGATAAAGDVLPGGVVPLRPRASSRGRAPGVLGVAAGAVGLLAVVGLGLGLARGGADGAGSMSEAGGGSGAVAAAPLSELPLRASGTDYRPDGDVFARALPGLLTPGGSAEAPLAAAEDRAAAEGTAKDSAATQDSTTTGGGTAGATGGVGAGAGPEPVAGAAMAPDPLARLRDPAELAGCLGELSGPDSEGVPLALDYATYQGQPALVVVLPSAREGKVDVFAVGAGCRAGDDQTLYFTRLDRP